MKSNAREVPILMIREVSSYNCMACGRLLSIDGKSQHQHFEAIPQRFGLARGFVCTDCQTSNQFFQRNTSFYQFQHIAEDVIH